MSFEKVDLHTHTSCSDGALTPDEVFALGLAADSAEAEAVVLSCTEMRAVEAVPALEGAIGKPVVTSNQAMMYAAAVMLGLDPASVPECGRLLSRDMIASGQKLLAEAA